MPSLGQPYNPFRVFVGCFIPNALLQIPGLSQTAKLVFGRLLQFAGRDGKAYPSYNTISREIGLSRRQIIRAVRELREYGLIRVVARFRTDGGSATNVYEFLWHEIFEKDSLLLRRSDIEGTPPSVVNVTPPECLNSLQGVSSETSKEKQIKEVGTENNTNEQILVLLSGSPFSMLTITEIELLVRKYGLNCVRESVDLAVETWRRDKKEILNPAGYIHSLCSSRVLPAWFQNQELRETKMRAIQLREELEVQKKQEEKIAAASLERAVNEYWDSLRSEEKEHYAAEVKSSLKVASVLSEKSLELVAKFNAWKERSKMSNN